MKQSTGPLATANACPRRSFSARLGWALAALLTACPALAASPPDPDWEHYKARFIQQDGRVIDYANNQMSHSEGQAFTLFLALHNADLPLFERLWAWTRDNLLTPEAQGLPAWSWGRRPDGAWGVLDANDASDADIVLAWTLEQAARRFNRPEWREAARALAVTIRTRLVREESGRLVLLPGREGFLKPDETAFNPSYFIFPAFHDLARLDDQAFWRALHASCLDLLGRSQAGPTGLPPDWAVLARGTVEPWGEKGRYFSYDAVRVPLYLAWDKNREALARFMPLLARFARDGRLPARIALAAGDQDQGEAPAGFYAVLARAAETLGDPVAEALWAKAGEKLPQEPDDYYSHVLTLMARVRGGL